MPLRIANAAGFLGDRLDAPRRTVEAAGVDYLTLEYLAELTMSILAAQRQKDRALGYARDWLAVLQSLTSALADQQQLRIVTNAGGMNATQCARASGRILEDAGLGATLLGIVTGDDLLSRLDEIQAAGCELAHLDTGRPLRELGRSVVCANAYLGARPIVEALADRARIVLTGRVADASLTVGPALHELGWKWDQFGLLAGGSVAGHLIECGAQVTGGYATTWEDVPLADVGYPIAELEADGSCVITKSAGTEGVVNRRTVVEQLCYEIGNPAHYLTPDVDVDFTTVTVEDEGNDRVAVRGASGRAPPDSYKVSLAYHDGYTAAGQLLVWGRDCVAKARRCAEIVRQRVRSAGFELGGWHVELLGTGEGVPGVVQPPERLREVLLRISTRDARREAVERFTKELAPLVTSGPAGVAGYAASRSPVRPVFAYWPTLVPKDVVRPVVAVRSARQWATENLG